jgi:ABC-type uncharacterized transport system substrate-binding protein
MKKLSYLIILGAIVTACNCTHPKTSIQDKIEIIMANDTCINDTSAFRWLEDDSTHTGFVNVDSDSAHYKPISGIRTHYSDFASSDIDSITYFMGSSAC